MKTFLIGFGRMGQRHYQVLKNVGISDISIFDINTNNSEVKIYASEEFQEYLISQCPELVVVASTAPSHINYIQQTVNAGVKYVFCEKPVCTSLAEAEILNHILKKYPDTKIAVNHQMRFMEQYTYVKKMITENNFGEIGSISIQAGNFGAAMNGTHYFEMFRFMTDQYPSKVCAWLKPQSSKNPRGDIFQDVAGSIRFENDKQQRFYMDISEDQGHGVFVTYTCKYGQIHVDELLGRVYVSRRKNSEDTNLPTTRYGLPAETYTLTIEPADSLLPTERVLKSLLEGRNFPSLIDGIMAVKTLIAAYASSDSLGKEVFLHDIPLDYQHKIFPWA